jgi:hypothetical protein
MGWDTVTAEQTVGSVKWDPASAEFSFVTNINKDPTGTSRYYHELRLTLTDLVALLKLVAGEGIKGSPEKVRDALKSKVGGEPADSIIKLLCCSSGYIPTMLPGAVAVKSPG